MAHPVKYLYMNDAQREVYNLGCRDTRIIGSRRLGKTTGMLAPNEWRAIRSMPRGVGVFLGNSAAQLKTRTVPAYMAALRDMFGLEEGRHFTWGRPSPSLGFADPIVKPREYKNVIQFFNGWCYHLVSLEVKGSANSITANRITADEARFLNKAKLDAEVMPILSGIPGFDVTNPFYKSTFFVSDAALTLKQDWMSKEEAKMTEGAAVVRDIRAMIARMEENVDRYGRDGAAERNRRLEPKLRELQCRGFFYGTYNTIDNIDIVGEDYIRQQKRDLPPLVFDISILNLTKKKASDGFYSAFNPDLHVYTADAAAVIDNAVVRRKVLVDAHGRRLSRPAEYESTDWARFGEKHSYILDTDVDAEGPLHIAFDYNANINCMVTGQPRRYHGIDSLMVLKSMYVKNDRKLRELCADWCDYYQLHPLKQVVYYYDQTAKFGGYADARAQRFYEIVQHELTRRGWQVQMVDIGNTMRHELKQQLIDDMLRGIQAPFIRINEENNDFLIVAIENTGVAKKSYGWGKDKSGEKRAETDDNPLETRTDITDAFDTLIIGVKFYQGAAYGLGCSRAG